MGARRVGWEVEISPPPPPWKLGKNGCLEEAHARKSLIDEALLGGGKVKK